MKTKYLIYSTILAWSLVIFLTGNYVISCTHPTQDPPSGNIIPSFSQWTTSGSSIYYDGGNVGVGTNNPGEKLEISGNIKLSGTSPIHKITNLAEPTNNSDAATKGYVDSLISSGGFNECTIHSKSHRTNNVYLSCPSGWETFYNLATFGCSYSKYASIYSGVVNIGSAVSVSINMYHPTNSIEYRITMGGQALTAQCRNTRNNWSAYAQVLMCCR